MRISTYEFGAWGDTVQLLTRGLAPSLSVSSSHAPHHASLWSPALLALFQVLKLAMLSWHNHPSPGSSTSHQTSVQPSLPATDWGFVSPAPSCKFICWSLIPNVMVFGDGTFGRYSIWMRSWGRAPWWKWCPYKVRRSLSLCHREHSCLWTRKLALTR